MSKHLVLPKPDPTKPLILRVDPRTWVCQGCGVNL